MCLTLLVGCSLGRENLDQALMADVGARTRNANVADCYLVRCPDVLEVGVVGRPDLSGRRAVGPDGCLDLGEGVSPHVEGKTAAECARVIAIDAGVPAERVRVRVAEYKSQRVYLFGQVMGLQRAVDYRGPETVLDLLQRTGGITRGAAPDDVYVVRAHVAEGGRPEVFHVRLRAILKDQNPRTNVRLQPFDQVYIGETGPSSLTNCIPPCVRPLYESFWGLRPFGGDSDRTRENADPQQVR